jgi:mannose-6-phosphate isomerase
MRPIRLEPNQLHRFYRGGSAIARLRAVASHDEYAPEDWVGSTTTVFGESKTGLSVLPDGRFLRDAIAANPGGFLGPEHVAGYGSDLALLVKLLDAGERLPVHFHPDQSFARTYLGLSHGKTEAWLIIETRAEGGSVHLGFREDMDEETLAGWVARQEAGQLLDALNELAVSPGDSVFVPAGLPHSIGKGVFLVELQEPTDVSVLLEWAGFAVDGGRDGHLGLGYEVALKGIRRRRLGSDELARFHSPPGGGHALQSGTKRLLPPEADPYFRAQALRPDPEIFLEPALSILIVLDGHGNLETEHGDTLELRRGQTVLVPYAARGAMLAGDISAIRCLPPQPS